MNNTDNQNNNMINIEKMDNIESICKNTESIDIIDNYLINTNSFDTYIFVDNLINKVIDNIEEKNNIKIENNILHSEITKSDTDIKIIIKEIKNKLNTDIPDIPNNSSKNKLSFFFGNKQKIYYILVICFVYNICSILYIYNYI
jgi:hypothetical protein